MSAEKEDTNSEKAMPEYDFTGGIRGKHSKAYSKGHTVRVCRDDGTVSVQHYTLEDGAVMLAPDVRKYFPDSESVNEALRALIKVAPKKRKTA